jgi:hypothetical protein
LRKDKGVLWVKMSIEDNRNSEGRVLRFLSQLRHLKIKESEAKGKEGKEGRRRERIRVVILERCANQPKSAPLTIMSLVNDISSQYNLKPIDISRELRALERDGSVNLIERARYTSLRGYALSPYANWFWPAVFATMLSLILVIITAGYVLYLSYAFGSLLILFLPGYSLYQFLYAGKEKHDVGEQSNTISLVQISLSVGLSLVIVSSCSLILDYTIGITPNSLLPLLVALTIVLLVLALNRKYFRYKLVMQVHSEK